MAFPLTEINYFYVKTCICCTYRTYKEGWISKEQKGTRQTQPLWNCSRSWRRIVRRQMNWETRKAGRSGVTPERACKKALWWGLALDLNVYCFAHRLASTACVRNKSRERPQQRGCSRRLHLIRKRSLLDNHNGHRCETELAADALNIKPCETKNNAITNQRLYFWGRW